jgi:hypothetical protein
MVAETITCDWKKCSIVARFHIEVTLQFASNLTGEDGLRLPFSRSHHNICAAHLDEYSAMRQPMAIYSLGKCPRCNPA